MVVKTNHSAKLIKELEQMARQLRIDVIELIHYRGQGHPGGSLSPAEIISALFSHQLRIDPKRPDWENRDRFILSKGHACSLLYAALARRGFFPIEEFKTWGCIGSRLQGHPQLGLPGLEISSGSLGQGLSIANGMALADRLDGIDPRIYCIMGDGETNEGQIWEAAMTAAHYKLDKLCGIVDFNKLQIDGFCCDVKDMKPYMRKWEDFGWYAVEVDGHDFKELMDAFDEVEKVKGKPQVVIAHTIKGKGVSFMENQVRWHGIAPKKDELERALKELDEEAVKL